MHRKYRYLIGRRVVVGSQGSFVLDLFCLVLFDVLLLHTFRQIAPHLPNNFSDFPQFQILIGSFHFVPNLPGVSHVRHERLLRGLGWFHAVGRALELEISFYYVSLSSDDQCYPSNLSPHLLRVELGVAVWTLDEWVLVAWILL